MPRIGPKRIAEFIAPFRVKPGRRVRLPRDFDPEGHRERSKDEAKEILAAGVELLAEYQARLAAQDTYALLVVLPGHGRGGQGRHHPPRHERRQPAGRRGPQLQGALRGGARPRLPVALSRSACPRAATSASSTARTTRRCSSCACTPRSWLASSCPPQRRPGDIWKRRFREINDWERYLTDQGYRIVKIFLNLSKEEQRRRFLARIDEPDKNWKFSAADVRERGFWDDYQKAFSEVLSHTSTEWAPWYVIPADDKPFARVAAAGVIADALIEIDPQYPTVSEEAREALQAAKARARGRGAAGRRRIRRADDGDGRQDGRKRRKGKGGKR